MNAPKLDVLAVIRKHADAHRALAGSDSYSAQEAPKLEATLAAVAELIEATRARRLLSEKIKHAGMPPHPDYWQQSVSDADARIDAALANIGSAS